ncbi:MAG: GntR family transcriptional regulator [Bifidobacteriaceae bacterium]|jgi:DNA-binding GntR family transcriptional regulator|nr:GntR family transcriptional regulator [Bifidobacteriaceae bacterium]
MPLTEVKPSIAVERSSPVPLYHQVASQLEAAIESGSVAVGSWLENEIDLAARLGVSRPTIRQAISQLVDAGLLIRQRGIGTRVVSSSIARPVAFTSFYEDMLAAGLEPRTTTQSVQTVSPSDELAQLFDSDRELIEIVRLRGAGPTPIALMRNWIPARFESVTAEALNEHGLYELMRSQGASLRSATQLIGARAADPPEAALLEIEPGAPCVTMKRYARDHVGELIEFGDHLYRGDKYHFTATLTAP